MFYLGTADKAALRRWTDPRVYNTLKDAGYFSWLLSGLGVVSIGLRDQGGDKSAEQGLSAAAGVMHELEGAEIERQLLL